MFNGTRAPRPGAALLLLERKEHEAGRGPGCRPGGAPGAVSLRGREGAGCAASRVEAGAAEGGLRGSVRPQRGGGRGEAGGLENRHRGLCPPLSTPARREPGEDFQESRAVPWWLSG